MVSTILMVAIAVNLLVFLKVNSLTLHNLHYIVLALCKVQVKEKIEILVQ